MTRADWRTCKRHEAEIVEENNDLVLYYLDETKEHWNCNPEECDIEINNWTLYGRRWLMDAPQWAIIAPRRPPNNPATDGIYSNPLYWYSHRIQYLNN